MRWTLLFVIFVAVEVARRLVAAEGPRPPVCGLRLRDYRMRSGDIILTHQTKRIAFLIGTPWTHAMFVLVDRHGRELICDIHCFQTCAIRDARVVLKDLVRRRVPVGVRRLNLDADARELFQYVRQKRHQVYTHDYVLPVINRYCWFLGSRPNDRSLVCSSFVAGALVHAGVLDPRMGVGDCLPSDLISDDGLIAIGGYRYGPVEQLHA